MCQCRPFWQMTDYTVKSRYYESSLDKKISLVVTIGYVVTP